MDSLSQPRLNIFTVGNMRVMICLGQGGLRSLSASSCIYLTCHHLIDVHFHKFFTCLDINKICLNQVRFHTTFDPVQKQEQCTVNISGRIIEINQESQRLVHLICLITVFRLTNSASCLFKVSLEVSVLRKNSYKLFQVYTLHFQARNCLQIYHILI